MIPGDCTFVALPAADAERIQRAIRQARSGRLGGCVHLADVPVAVWCWQHPGRLWCLECFDRHSKTHTQREEFGCDLCGDDMRDAGPLMVALSGQFELDELVPIGRGRWAAVGTVIVGAWAQCARCTDEVTA